MGLGESIKMCRVNKGMTQKDLADETGLSMAYISLLERNKRNPTLSTVEKISKSLNVPMVLVVFMASSDNRLIGNDLELLLNAESMKVMRGTR